MYGKRKSKPRVKSELRKQPYTVTLFDSRKGSLANAKNWCVTVQFSQGLIHGGAYFLNFTVDENYAHNDELLCEKLC